MTAASDRSAPQLPWPALFRWLLAGLTLLGFYLASRYSFLLVHTLAELTTICVSGAVLLLIWNARYQMEDQFLLIVGLGTSFAAMVDLVHTLAYRGMPIFPGFDADLPTQLWIVARYLQAFSLLAALRFVRRRVRIHLALAAYVLVTALLLILVFTRTFPSCYVEGVGLTPFKKISEYVISGILVLATAGLWLERGSFDRRLVPLLMAANLLTVGAELVFTAYVSVYGEVNLLGHVLKLAAYVIWYRAIVEAGVRQPAALLYRRLRQSEELYSTLIDTSPEGVTLTDPDGRIRLASRKTLEIHGLREAGEAIGRPLVEWVAAEDRDRFRDDLAGLERGISVVQPEYTLLRGDGSRLAGEILCALVRDERGRSIGVMAVIRDITERKRADEALRLAQVAHAREMQQRATLEERQRLSRELHDSVSQALYGISLGVHAALAHGDTDPIKARESLEYALTQTTAGLTEMRALIFELRPESLEQEGLVVALTKQTDAIRARFDITVELAASREPELPLAAKEALYRIVQEALHNAVRHAKCDRLEVRLLSEPDCVRVEVNDDGAGFDPRAPHPGHLGLQTMRERATSLGGELQVVSSPGHGTLIVAQIPIASLADA